MPKNMGPLYLLLILPSVLLTVCDIIDRIRHKDSHAVRWSLLLEVILSGSSFLALLGALANGLDYFYGESPDVLWFVIMMSVIYSGLLVYLLLIRCNRIVYTESGDVRLYKIFRKSRTIRVADITRLHLDNEYLDVYIGDERIRYMSTFLSGAEDFKAFVREQKSEKRSKKP